MKKVPKTPAGVVLGLLTLAMLSFIVLPHVWETLSLPVDEVMWFGMGGVFWLTVAHLQLGQFNPKG